MGKNPVKEGIREIKVYTFHIGELLFLKVASIKTSHILLPPYESPHFGGFGITLCNKGEIHFSKSA